MGATKINPEALARWRAKAKEAIRRSKARTDKGDFSTINLDPKMWRIFYEFSLRVAESWRETEIELNRLKTPNKY